MKFIHLKFQDEVRKDFMKRVLSVNECTLNQNTINRDPWNFFDYYPHLPKDFILNNLFFVSSRENYPYRDDFTQREMKKLWIKSTWFKPFSWRKLKQELSEYLTKEEMEDHIHKRWRYIFNTSRMKYFFFTRDIIFADVKDSILHIKFRFKGKILEIDSSKFSPRLTYRVPIYKYNIEETLKANPHINLDFYLRSNTYGNFPESYLSNILEKNSVGEMLICSLNNLSPKVIQDHPRLIWQVSSLSMYLSQNLSFAVEAGEACFNNHHTRKNVKNFLKDSDIKNLKDLYQHYDNPSLSFQGLYFMIRSYPRKGWFQDTDINEIDESLPLLSQNYSETLRFWNDLSSKNQPSFVNRKRMIEKFYYISHTIKAILQVNF